LKDRGRVQLIDCDVEEPNAHIFIKPVITRSEPVSIPVPRVDENKCTYCGGCARVCAYNAIAVIEGHVLVFPELCHGCGACSYLCPEKALTEEDRIIGTVESGYADGLAFAQGKLNIGEPMAGPIIRKVKSQASNNGTVILDVPPGTSCPVVESVTGSHFCLLVTEPTPFGLNDLALAVKMVRKLNIPCGVVLNRAGASNGLIAEYCRKEEIPVLLTIPLDTEIGRLYSRGIVMAEGMPQWRDGFIRLFNQIEEMVSERSRYTER
jgi:MinD superfamily P-loop ATPase